MEDGGRITIGTTRPELIPACVAVFYHPEDPRYQQLKGKFALTPLFKVKVPLLADENVKMDKGTGLVMCCTFGDDTDKMWWRKYNLPMRVVLNQFGRIREPGTTHAGGKLSELHYNPEATRDNHDEDGFIGQNDCVDIDETYRVWQKLVGLKVSNTDPKHPGARQKILELIKEAGLLVKQEAITHAVKCAERSGAPIEIMDTWQWYIKVCDKKEALLDKARQCVWRPEFMRLRIEQWIEGLNQDWCISRQRYFGVPFPVWYSKRAGEEGKILVADKDQLPVNPLVDLPKGYTKEEVTPDMDVMDTWATSSVSPQLSSKAINKDFAVDIARHQQLFPADLRPQAHEIIRTWAFYTIVKAHLHEDTIPWKNLMISGWCLAADKTKMSKSKGNVITPTSLIEEKGSDAVRYWASTSRLGSDTAFSEDVLKIGNKLVNKLWNASKFALIHLEKVKGAPQLSAVTEPLDRWIITRLSRAIEKATTEFVEYEYCAAREHIEDFFWKDFCDNYLEMIKVRAYGEGPAAASAHHATALCLEAVLRLFAPFVPHITEELYQNLFPAKHSIHARNTWPKASAYFVDEAAEASGIAAVEVLDAVRVVKAEKKVSIKWPLESLTLSSALKEKISPVMEDVKAVTNAKELLFADGAGCVLAHELSEKSDAA